MYIVPTCDLTTDMTTHDISENILWSTRDEGRSMVQEEY
jgi:hypothetical protein